MIEGLALRIFKWPIIALNAWDIRTLVATPHGDKERGALRELIGQPLRSLRAELYSHLTHDVDDCRMHTLPRLRPR